MWLRAIDLDLSEKCDLEQNENWCNHVPENVLENDMKLLWGFIVCEQIIQIG